MDSSKLACWALLSWLLLACAASGPTSASPPASPPAKISKPERAAGTPVAAATPAPEAGAAKGAPSAPKPAVPFVDDDFDAALSQAEAQRKLLFVDAWAEWCHTCKSMKSFVFTDPALGPFGARVVFAALDTDKPANAGFLEQFTVDVWPSLFAIDPPTRRLVGFWPGSASLEELRDFLQNSLDAQEALHQSALDPKSPQALLIRAKSAGLAGDPAQAASLYAEALERAPGGWTRQSEALHGQLWALARARRPAECVTFGERHLDQVQGTSLPGFYASILLGCLEHEPDSARRSRVRQRIIARLRPLLEAPPAAMSADDQEDTWRILAEALRAEGKPGEAQSAQEQRLRIMEHAAENAGSPEAASTFDAGRASAYVALGRGDEAVALLQARIRQLPESYEPPGRLAATLEMLGRPEKALGALDLALDKAYGPRRLKYLEQRARLLAALGRMREQVETLEAEVRGHRELARGQASAPRLRAAEQRLARARAALNAIE